MNMEEARRIVKAELKASGHKISHFASSDINACAKELMDYENKPKAKQSRKAKGK